MSGRLLAIACGLLFAAALHAQGDAPVQRPQVQAGDIWTYRRIDHVEGRNTVVSLEVTFANERVIHLVQISANGDKETDVTMTSAWNMVSSSSSGVYDPHSGLMRFPMRPGDTWQFRYTLKFPRRDYEVKNDRTVSVHGWEDVQVPAGKFRALRIVSEGPAQRSDKGGGAVVRETVWYVPQVKRFVRWIFENASRRGPLQHWEYELLEYQLKQ